MTTNLNRRNVLKGIAGTAGLLAGAGLRPALAASTAESGADNPRVAVQRCTSFEPRTVRKKLDAAFDSLGGLKEKVNGKTVSIKINMTGMTWNPCCGLPPYETYQTNPHTVAALCAALHDAGARRMVVIENYYEDRPPEDILADSGWDIDAIRSAGGGKVSFEDVRHAGRWSGYSRFEVPWGGFIYPAFDLNRRFEKTDVLISLSKLKQHACAGVTMTAKNSFGNAPTALYGNKAPGSSLVHRTKMFHGGSKDTPDGVPSELAHDISRNQAVRVPHIVADLYAARPADLAIVEGIQTISGGEGAWNDGIGLQKPGVLLAGWDGLATDAVGTAVMGFDPRADHGAGPFQGTNHLRLLASVGFGTIDLDEIEVVGLPLSDAVHPFASKARGYSHRGGAPCSHRAHKG